VCRGRRFCMQNLLWRCGCGGELRGVRRAAVPAWPMPNLTHTEAFCLGLSLLRVPARAIIIIVFL
jgi:hypothetical protein